MRYLATSRRRSILGFRLPKRGRKDRQPEKLIRASYGLLASRALAKSIFRLPFVYAILLRRQMRLKLATDGKFSQLAQACGAFAKGGQRVDCVGG